MKGEREPARTENRDMENIEGCRYEKGAVHMCIHCVGIKNSIEKPIILICYLK